MERYDFTESYTEDFSSYSKDLTKPNDKILTHQIWMGGEIPKREEQYRKDFLKKYPQYENKLHYNSDLRNLIKKYYSKYLPVYDSFQYDIERIDFFRYAMLHHFGGIYLDLDMIVLKPLDFWIKKNKIVLGFEPKEHLINWKQIPEHYNKYKEENIIGNAILISPKKGNIFWLKLMDYIAENYKKDNGPVLNTGPYCLTRFCSENKEICKDILIEPSFVFYPKKDENINPEKTYTKHIWAHSWFNQIKENQKDTENSEQNTNIIWLIIYIFALILIILISFMIEFGLGIE